MVTITEEMKGVFERMKMPVVATASVDGKPNVVPIAFAKVMSDNEILLMDNYMDKTRRNIEANPEVAVSVWDMEMRRGFQFKGNASIHVAGNLFEESVKWVKSRRPQINPKAAIVIKIQEIYSIGSGEYAGKRIA